MLPEVRQGAEVNPNTPSFAEQGTHQTQSLTEGMKAPFLSADCAIHL